MDERLIISGDAVAIVAAPVAETLDFPKGDPYEHISPSCEVINHTRDEQ